MLWLKRGHIVPSFHGEMGRQSLLSRLAGEQHLSTDAFSSACVKIFILIRLRLTVSTSNNKPANDRIKGSE